MVAEWRRRALTLVERPLNAAPLTGRGLGGTCRQARRGNLVYQTLTNFVF